MFEIDEEKKKQFKQLYNLMTEKQRDSLFVMLSEPFSLREMSKHIEKDTQLGKFMLDLLF